MMKRNKNLMLNDNMNMELLLNSEKKPDLYARNEEPFWDDPHIGPHAQNNVNIFDRIR